MAHNDSMKWRRGVTGFKLHSVPFSATDFLCDIGQVIWSTLCLMRYLLYLTQVFVVIKSMNELGAQILWRRLDRWLCSLSFKIVKLNVTMTLVSHYFNKIDTWFYNLWNGATNDCLDPIAIHPDLIISSKVEIICGGLVFCFCLFKFLHMTVLARKKRNSYNFLSTHGFELLLIYGVSLLFVFCTSVFLPGY